jgi:hypothetical protein
VPIRHREVDRRSYIERQSREVKAKSPVENVVVREITEVAETIWARCPAEMAVRGMSMRICLGH